VDTPAALATSYSVTTLVAFRLAWRIAIAPIRAGQMARSAGTDVRRVSDFPPWV
jgi:hypothetical protein